MTSRSSRSCSPKRRVNLAHLIHNLQLLVTEVGTKDKELAELVVSQNAVFEAFANQDKNLRETFQLLPGTLRTTNSALAEVRRADHAARADAARAASRRARARQRAARDCGLRARDHPADPGPDAAVHARGATRREGAAPRGPRPGEDHRPSSTTSFDVINTLLNALGYNPPGTEEGYLFWALWLNHIGASVYSTQDAHGLIRRGIIFTDCIALGALEATREDRQPARHADRPVQLRDQAGSVRQMTAATRYEPRKPGRACTRTVS